MGPIYSLQSSQKPMEALYPFTGRPGYYTQHMPAGACPQSHTGSVFPCVPKSQMQI